MRTGKTVPLGIAAGLIGIVLLASVPTASACSLTSGTSCIMDIYYNERNNAYVLVNGATGTAGAKLHDVQVASDGARNTANEATQGAQDQASQRSGAMGVWAQGAESRGAACASPAPDPGPLPALPTGYDPGPAVDSNLQYIDDQSGVAGQFVSVAGSDPFGGAASALLTGWGNTQGVFDRWDEHVFEPLVFGPVADLGSFDGSDVPAVPDPGSFDPGEVDAGALAAGAAERGGCFAAAPQPLPSI